MDDLDATARLATRAAMEVIMPMLSPTVEVTVIVVTPADGEDRVVTASNLGGPRLAEVLLAEYLGYGDRFGEAI